MQPCGLRAVDNWHRNVRFATLSAHIVNLLDSSEAISNDRNIGMNTAPSWFVQFTNNGIPVLIGPFSTYGTKRKYRAMGLAPKLAWSSSTNNRTSLSPHPSFVVSSFPTRVFAQFCIMRRRLGNFKTGIKRFPFKPRFKSGLGTTNGCHSADLNMCNKRNPWTSQL